MRFVILVEKIFDKFTDTVHNQFDLAVGDIEGRCDDDVIATDSIGGPRPGVDVDAVLFGKTCLYISQKQIELLFLFMPLLYMFIQMLSLASNGFFVSLFWTK